MQIQILGTGAADGWPGLFCGCPSCTRSKQAGGKNIRSRSSILIDGISKIDFPPDSFHHVVSHNLDLSRLKYLFFTHSHPDHFSPDEITYLRPSFAGPFENAPVRIYGNEQVISAVKARCNKFDLLIELYQVQPYIPIKAGNLTFTGIVAKHTSTELSLNYIVQSERSTILYACDTGFYSDEVLDFLSRYVFDVIIVECTKGLAKESAESHMSMSDVGRLKRKLDRAGAVTEHPRVILTHLSHEIGLLHDELAQIAESRGLEVGYDGMVIEV